MITLVPCTHRLDFLTLLEEVWSANWLLRLFRKNAPRYILLQRIHRDIEQIRECSHCQQRVVNFHALLVTRSGRLAQQLGEFLHDYYREGVLNAPEHSRWLVATYPFIDHSAIPEFYQHLVQHYRSCESCFEEVVSPHIRHAHNSRKRGGYIRAEIIPCLEGLRPVISAADMQQQEPPPVDPPVDRYGISYFAPAIRQRYR